MLKYPILRYHLIEEIELITRQFLEIPNVVRSDIQSDISANIEATVLKSDKVLELWDSIAQPIPPQHEPYSNELLTTIVDLWISVRGHSFAKLWSMKSDNTFKKSTRKTLKKKTEE